MKIKKVHPDAIIPTKATDGSAGWDLYAIKDACIWPGKTVIFDTGIAIELPRSTFGGVYSRSGLSTKKSLAVINGVGVIDADYRNTIKVPLHNHSSMKQWIRKGDRIAQLIIQLSVPENIKVVDELSETERGLGGFGSTGR